MKIDEMILKRTMKNQEVKVSVITPTIREKGLDIVYKSLLKQTFKNFEWLVGSPFRPTPDFAKWVKDDFKGGYWSLNRIYNKLFKEAKGNIVISLQDWIWIPPDAIERMVETLKVLPRNSIVSVVGDQYEKLGELGKPEVKIWSDPRKTDKYGSLYPCFYNDIEWNLCAMNKKIIFDIGGFDEKMDFRCRGVDAIQVMERLSENGVETFLSQDLESFTLHHGREDYGGEKAWNDSHGLLNGEYDKRKKELKLRGEWPKLEYLK